MGYELCMTPRHALFVQGGGSFPIISDETEYGLGLQYKYFLQPVHNARFLWLFRSAYKTTFGDINIRYMNLAEGIYNEARYSFESSNIGVNMRQTWFWNKGFTISYWLGYGPPFFVNINGRIQYLKMVITGLKCISGQQDWISAYQSGIVSEVDKYGQIKITNTQQAI